MSRARDLADSADKDIVGTLTVDGLTVAGNVSVDSGTIKLDGNYPVGTGNVALGDAAMNGSISGNYNTALGDYSMQPMTSGASNTGVGGSALRFVTSGSYNTAVGHQSLHSNTTASYNTAVGSSALYSNTTGVENTSSGYASMYNNTTGNYNTAYGRNAVVGNTTGSNNVGIGYYALAANTTAPENTAVGYQAGYSNTTGNQNTFLGSIAGYSNTTGTVNTFLGEAAGYYMTTGSKNVIIGRYNGNQGGLDIRTANNYIVLSDGDGNPRCYWDSSGALNNINNVAYGFNAVFRNSNANQYGLQLNMGGGQHIYFYRNGSGTGTITDNGSNVSYNTSSDYRLKENIVDLTGATERLKQLQPRRFNFIGNETLGTIDGFIAHETATVVPEAVQGTKDQVDADGNPVYQGIDQSKLVPLLVATIKELEARITALENA